MTHLTDQEHELWTQLESLALATAMVQAMLADQGRAVLSDHQIEEWATAIWCHVVSIQALHMDLVTPTRRLH